MWIRTLPVYSRLAEPDEVPPEVAARLPEGWQLSKHQVETYKALTEGDADVIFNTAMTGDGKSLAAYLPALANPQRHAFGMYPTIELSRDQARQFAHYTAELRQPLAYCSLWGAELTRLAEEYQFQSRGHALQERFENHNVVLTNPDIFNLVMNYRYGSLIFSEQELPYSLCTNFDYMVFDEFHVFAMPQIVAAVTAMVYIQEYYKASHKFLFSSATTSDVLKEMVERGGLRSRTVAGTYVCQDRPGYRLVLHPATLHFVPLGERQTAEDWIREHLQELAATWKEQWPRPKGAVVVNSVATARRIASLLQAELAPQGITVGENTGLTDAERRRVSLTRDIVVGTSTIDVGVDFNINLLIFECTNAGTFLQRLGRLGRCRGSEPAFERYEAHALISGKTPWIHERLVRGLAEQGIAEGDPVDRATQLGEVVHAAFTLENDFANYAKRWGVLQAAHIVNVLEARKRQGAYTSLTSSLARRYEQLFRLSDFGKARKRYWYLAGKDRVDECRPILDEVLAFRGSSPFQVGCWDVTAEPDAFLTYELFPLVQGATYVLVTAEEYRQAMTQRYSGEEQTEISRALKYVMRGKGDKPLILKILEFKPEREWLKLRVSEDLSVLSEQVFVLRRLAIAEPTGVQLPAVNEVLKQQAVVCYATRRDPRELRRMLHLPAHFPLYTAQDMHRNRDYTLVFGKAALMLEAQMIGWRKRSVEDEPIFC